MFWEICCETKDLAMILTAQPTTQQFLYEQNNNEVVFLTWSWNDEMVFIYFHKIH